MYIITQYAKVLKKRTRILTKKYRLYAAFSVFLPLQLSNFRVFECLVEPHDYTFLQNELLKIADLTKDSLRFYNLGAKYNTKIEHFGTKTSYDPEGVLMF